MPIYFAQFVVIEENLWMADGAPEAVRRRSRNYRIATQLFAASDSESAHSRAGAMIEGFTDSHNDGPGDRTNFSCAGLHNLEEVPLFERTLAESLDEPYGLDVGEVELGESAPQVRTRTHLSLFAVHRAD